MSSPESADFIRAQIQGEVTGQVAIGTHILQVGSVHGGVVNLTVPDTAPQPRERPTPIVLRPRPISGWLDRRVELETAARGLRASIPVEISGEPGIGRTALLRRLAHLPDLSAPHGVIYLNAAGQLSGDLLQSIFDAFYEYPASARPTPTQVQLALSTRRALVLIDDLELTREGVERVLDALPESTVVITNPRRTMWAEAQSIELRGLPEAESVQLLERELGRAISENEGPASVALAAALGGHPIRLLQAGAAARQAHATLDRILSHVESHGPAALTADLAGPLEDDDRKVFAALAAIGVAIPADAIAAIAEVKDPAPALRRLLDRGLIHEHRARYAVVAGVAVPADVAAKGDAARSRAIAFYSEWAAAHANAPETIAAQADILNRLHTEAAASGQSRQVLRIGSALGVVFALTGRWEAWAAVLDRNLSAARAVGDRAAEALALHESGTRALCVGETSSAQRLLEEAIDIRTSLGDQIGAAVSRHNAGLLSPVAPSKPSSDPRAPQQNIDFDTIRTGATNTSFVAVVREGSSWAMTALLIVLGLVGAGGAAWWLMRGSGTTQDRSQIATVAPGQTETGGPATTGPVTPGPAIEQAPPPATNANRSQPGPLTASLTPEDLDFGAHEVRASPTSQELIVTNTGNARLPIGAIDVTGPGSDDFSVNGELCANGLAAGESCKLSVSFTPSVEGERAAVITVKGQGSFKWTAKLAGTGAPQARALADLPDAVDFGARTVKTAGDRRTVVITSRGSKLLSIDGVALRGENPGDFKILTNTCKGAELQNGADCKILLEFSPSSVGTRRAQLEVTDNAGQGPQTVSLSGQATAAPVPKARLVPERLEFQRQVVGRQGAVQTVRINNEGNAPLSIANVTLEGLNPRDFRITTNTCAGKSVPPGEMCTLAVTFTPTAAGPRVGLLTVAHNAGDEGRSADLVGTAEARAVGEVSPARLDFNEVAFGKKGLQKALTVENVGGDVLRVDRVFFDGNNPRDFPVAENRCVNATLKRGESCTLVVQFAPNEVGSRSGVLIVTTDDGGRREIPLSGVALGRGELALSTDRLDFGSQELQSKAKEQLVTIRNSGTATLTLGPLLLEPSDMRDFVVIDRDQCANSKLDPNKTCTFAIGFVPAKSDQRLASVFVSESAGSRLGIKLNGLGRDPRPALVGDLRIDPGSIDFGEQLLPSRGGRSVKPQGPLEKTFTITNVGTGTVQIEDIFLDPAEALREFGLPGPSCRGLLPPGKACTVVVSFRAVLPGRRQPVVLVRSNAIKNPHRVLLAGAGREAEVSGGDLDRCNTDLAVESIGFDVLNRRSQFEADVQITGRARNRGPGVLSGGTLALFEGGKLIREEKVSSLVAVGKDVSVVYKRPWNSSSPAEGEFPPTYQLVVKIPDDCNTKNNSLDKDSSEINKILRTGKIPLDPGGFSRGRSSQIRPDPVPKDVPPPAPPPEILRFFSEDKPGEPRRLCYLLRGVVRARIDPDIGDVIPASATKCVNIAPKQTTQYILYAEGADGRMVKDGVTVSVVSPKTQIRQTVPVKPTVRE